MSKELIEELNEQVLTYDEWAREKCTEKLAIDRIEELERTVEFQKAAWAADLAENGALQADNAELVAALEKCRDYMELPAQDRMVQPYTEVCEALAKVRKP